MQKKLTNNLILTVVFVLGFCVPTLHSEYLRYLWCLPFTQKKKEQEENSPLTLVSIFGLLNKPVKLKIQNVPIFTLR